MKKILLLVFILACWLQASNPQQPRQVKGQVLISTYQPAIRIRFENEFKYAGTQKFILYERAQAEQHFFVDADSHQHIKRMYMVQFEGYLPGIDASYNYPVTETVTLAGQQYIVNAETIPTVSDVVKQNPESDAARAISFLQSKGYRPSESIKFQRFVRLVDEAKRNEIIFVYVEDAGSSSAQEKPDKEFSARALKGFTVLQ
jgi:hypothetical protein